MREPARGSQLAAWGVWLLALAALTAVMLAVRAELDRAHVALAYLLLVLAASTRGPRQRGLTLALLAFLCFNFFFVPPYGSFLVHASLDWIVLVSFLVVAAVSTQLFHRARALAVEADHAATLREADRLKDALLASVSHDLRTPLTTIKALAHDIAAEGDARAADIEAEADRLNRFVVDLLDLSRLTAGALPVQLEIVAAEDVLGAALQRVAGSFRHEVRVDLPAGEVLAARMDFLHTLRVLVNLLENASKYVPTDSPVELSVRQEGERLLFLVADRGPGIPPEEAESIFAPFRRGTAQQPLAEGAGLGLSIARQLAEAQGGALHYHARPGGGSIFVYSLPAADLTGMAASAD